MRTRTEINGQVLVYIFKLHFVYVYATVKNMNANTTAPTCFCELCRPGGLIPENDKQPDERNDIAPEETGAETVRRVLMIMAAGTACFCCSFVR